MVTITFISSNGQHQLTVSDSQKKNAINSLLVLGYVILQIN